jgi:hypothetical protein
MKKLVKENGFMYSLESFTEYETRSVVRITTVGESYLINLYSTNKDREQVEEFLLNRRKEDVTRIYIEHFATKAQDEATARFINELDL